MNYENKNYVLFNVYKTSKGLYLDKNYCNKLGIGNPYNRKTIKGIECYEIEILDIVNIETTSIYKSRIIPVLDLTIQGKLPVLVDTNNENNIYVEKNICLRYDIKNQKEKTINNKVYFQLTLEQLDEIEIKSINKRMPIIRAYKEIELEKEAETIKYYKTNHNIYIDRKTLEFARKNNIEFEAKPIIINNKNYYAIKQKELDELLNTTNANGIRTLIKEPKTIEKIIIYKNKENNKLYIPTKYYNNNKIKTIMKKECSEITLNEIENIYNKEFIIINVNCKKERKETLNITICKFINQLFIREDLLNLLNIKNSLQKRIKVNGNVYIEITEEELSKVENTNNYLINITKKEIIRN